MNPWPILVAGVIVLAAAWFGPLPAFSRQSFAAHMVMHVSVIAVAAPLLVIGIAGTRFDPVRRVPRLFSPIPASVLEFAIVWIWHAPVLHHAARQSTSLLIVEQGTFLAAGLLVWLATLGGSPLQRRQRIVPAISGLLLTSMHMTLLGVLLALADRELYFHAGHGSPLLGMTPMLDQQLGGVIMLLVGGLAYFGGALYLVSTLLTEKRRAALPG